MSEFARENPFVSRDFRVSLWLHFFLKCSKAPEANRRPTRKVRAAARRRTSFAVPPVRAQARQSTDRFPVRDKCSARSRCGPPEQDGQGLRIDEPEFRADGCRRRRPRRVHDPPPGERIVESLTAFDDRRDMERRLQCVAHPAGTSCLSSSVETSNQTEPSPAPSTKGELHERRWKETQTVIATS